MQLGFKQTNEYLRGALVLLHQSLWVPKFGEADPWSLGASLQKKSINALQVRSTLSSKFISYLNKPNCYLVKESPSMSSGIPVKTNCPTSGIVYQVQLIFCWRLLYSFNAPRNLIRRKHVG